MTIAAPRSQAPRVGVARFKSQNRARQVGLLRLGLTLLCGALFLVGAASQVSAGAESTTSPIIAAGQVRTVRAGLRGIVGRVMVVHRTRVAAGEVVATLDSSELDFQIEYLEIQIQTVDFEAQSAQGSAAAGQVASLTQHRLMLFKKRLLQCELSHKLAQRRQLEIRAPVAGWILTPDPQQLVGRLVAAGEPIVDIASDATQVP